MADNLIAELARQPVLAYSIDQLPYGRTYVYELIRQGKLKAKKSGRRTLITREAWNEHLASLPDLGTSAA